MAIENRSQQSRATFSGVNREGTKRYFQFDRLGSTMHLADDTSAVTDSYTYDDASRPEKMTYDTGAYALYTYDGRSRIKAGEHKNSSHTLLRKETNTYDAASRITSRFSGTSAEEAQSGSSSSGSSSSSSRRPSGAGWASVPDYPSLFQLMKLMSVHFPVTTAQRKKLESAMLTEAIERQDASRRGGRSTRPGYSFTTYNCASWIGDVLERAFVDDPRFDEPGLTGSNKANSPKEILDIVRNFDNSARGFAPSKWQW